MTSALYMYFLRGASLYLSKILIVACQFVTQLRYIDETETKKKPTYNIWIQ